MTTARIFFARHVPPTVPPVILTVLSLAFAALTVARGADYATAGRPAGGSLQLLDALPGGIALWGWVLIATGAHLWVAYLARVHIAVWTAHILLIGVYFGMAAAIARAGTLGQSWAPILVPVGGVLWHGFMAWLVRPFPDTTHGR